tara:strand:- start:2045 stop:4099 length:2055 start_codon:yes stop_codon:yes gene_type:complete
VKAAQPGIERIFSWSALDERSRVALIVTFVLAVSIAPTVGQSVETGWVSVESGTEVDLNAAVVSGNEVWAFGDSGVAIFSTDGGLTWSTHASLGESDLIAADSLEDSIAVLAADGIVHLRVGLDGEWQQLDSMTLGMAGIALTGDESLVLVGDGGVVMEFSNGMWNDRTSAFTEDLNDVAFYGGDDGFAVGDSGTILATTDGGSTWDYREAPAGAQDASIVSVEFFNPYRMFAISDSGQILYSTSSGGHEWNLREIESEGYNTTLDRELSSIEVVSASKILFTGPNGFLGLSTDQGLNVEENLLPEGVSTSFNDHAMIDHLIGVVVGDSGVILYTTSSGENELVGFEIPDYNNFGEFVEYADEMLLGGFIATVKIVLFGILFGFVIGVILAMMKTAPTSFKNIFERAPLNAVKGIGGALIILGIWLIYSGASRFGELGLSGIQYIFTPVGDPSGFAMFALGLGLFALGVQFVRADIKLSGPLFKVKPLNTLATVYTDFFRNTPLIVQFMFIHFGLSLGMRIQRLMEGTFGDAGIDGLDYFIYGERTFLSAIFALGLNSGAYQCETIRGAISAIPSGQMEAGRSIGLTYLGTMKLVIMPQAIRICIPPIGNEMVNLVLNSSLAMVIGYSELSRQGRLMIATTFQIFYAWGLVMISYFVVTWTLALLLRRLEDWSRIPGLGISGGG